jgi:hypothetical protein
MVNNDNDCIIYLECMDDDDNGMEVCSIGGECLDDVEEIMQCDDMIDDCSSVEADWSIPHISGEPRMKIDMTDTTPIEYFDLLMSADIQENIVEQTNMYADQYFEENPNIPPRSRLHNWIKNKFSTVDFYKFLALIIIMGIIHYPKIEDYWAQFWPFSTTTFNSVMSRDRFSTIMRFLHINDKRGQKQKGEEGYDALYKIRPLLTALLTNFGKYYEPGRELQINPTNGE